MQQLSNYDDDISSVFDCQQSLVAVISCLSLQQRRRLFSLKAQVVAGVAAVYIAIARPGLCVNQVLQVAGEKDSTVYTSRGCLVRQSEIDT